MDGFGKGPAEGIRRNERLLVEGLTEREAKQQGLEMQVWQSGQGLRNALTMRRATGLRIASSR